MNYLVPIYDARIPIKLGASRPSSSNTNTTPDFAFTSYDIRRIPRTYSTYYKNNEIPSGSLAMVGYMMGCYEKDDEWMLTPNLNWVVVLAADD